MRKMLWCAVIVAAGCASDEQQSTSSQNVDGVTIVDGNPTCADLGLGSFSYKIDPPTPGTFSLDGLNTVTMTSVDGIYADWSASIGMDAVIVKGGPMANVYTYDPEQSSGQNVSPPINPNNGVPYAISHIEFCFDYELTVAKTANPAFTRTFAWTIDKSAPIATATLAAGQVLTVPYTVAVAVAGFTDSDWNLSGAIQIHNPAPFAATVVSVLDSYNAVPVALSCPFDLPYSLAAGATVTCTYELALAGPTGGTNVVDVATTGVVGGASASATADFACATITERDRCITVSDDRAGALGQTCIDATYAYNLNIGPYATCDTTDTFTNTASFVANDTGATGSDSWSISVTVPACDVGCTLTPGYWKTHSAHGPAPYDDLWAQLPSGADTTFFLSGASYYTVLWTPSSHGAYYTLARAYIAAQLNQLNGASGGAVAAVFADATQIFNTYTPQYLAAQKRNSWLLQRVLYDASVLDQYNNGLIGPGHCSE